MSLLKQVHHWILKNNQIFDKAIDMTAGNGHDTYFLASHFNEVIAVDIQKQAIESTQNRLREFQNVTYLLKDHSQIDFTSTINGAMYNLGYLPHSDKSIITTANSTIKSLDNLFPYLTDFITITCYIGHDGGKEEHEAVLNWIEKHTLEPTILRYEHTENSPIAYCIKL
ncbi:MAG: methyltransferase domain-containing protein [Erysipelothrix sp.]|nr:methyltransferase domain-containing protein [Erysipelothrix sp.]